MENVDLPPYPLLFQALENATMSTPLYVKMWEKRDENNSLRIYFDEVIENYYISKTKFLNHLVTLAKKGLIHFTKTKLSVNIEFVTQNDLDRECG